LLLLLLLQAELDDFERQQQPVPDSEVAATADAAAADEQVCSRADSKKLISSKRMLGFAGCCSACVRTCSVH
jgi:hypothetical protein